MDHTHIVTANDLDRYSDTRDSEAVIPELIYLLVKQSVPPPHVCRIPYGDTVNQSGWDGIVEIEESFLEFVPKGKSYWEIGTGRDPQKKATEDFKKRTETVTELGVITTPSEHWELILSQGDKSDPPLPAKLFTEGRSNVCDALEAVFKGESQQLFLFAESEQDVDDFVAAYLATLDKAKANEFTNRCLFMKKKDAWSSVAEIKTSHVLVADPQIKLETPEGAKLRSIARQKGHAVIIPICGAWSGDSPEIIKLLSPTQSQIEAVLKEAGYPEMRARDLARAGGDSLSALRRYLQGFVLPPYATWGNARLIAQAGLAGRWDGENPADRSALEMLLGKGYGEWIEILRPDVIRSDSPLIQSDEKWRFVARGEAWNALGKRITDEDLDRPEETAVAVLGERDPKFDLHKWSSVGTRGIGLEPRLPVASSGDPCRSCIN